jgi:hypothetical protein
MDFPMSLRGTNMCNLRSLAAAMALALTAVSSAWAGAGVVSGSITPLGGSNVTYSIASPVMDTFVGYTVALSNTGGNTVNGISFTVTASATDAAEAVVLVNESFYLPAACAKTAPNVFSCTVGQLGAGASFPSFQVFYKSPVKVLNGSADTDGTDFVNLTMHVEYAEGSNGANPNNPPDNSIRDFDAPPVLLGTFNADHIKSGVPKTGASLYTGTGGIPTGSNKSTMLANVPPLTASFTTAELQITRVTDDANTGDAACIAQGNFRECPTYGVTIPGTFAFLTTTYRIDASSLKKAPGKILSDVIIKYSDPAAVPPVQETIVGQCAGLNTPRSDGIPCINKQVCYKNNAQPAALASDCEWELINTKNGLTRFF